MSDEPTTTIELEVTEQQLDDAMRFINKGELGLREEGYGLGRVRGLTNVWCQLYDADRSAFADHDGGEQ